MDSKLLTARKPRPRYRFKNAFQEVLTNELCAHIGQMTERGYSPGFIADWLNNGVTSQTIDKMQRTWGLKKACGKGTQHDIKVSFTERQRANIEARAKQRGLSVAEYCRRIMVKASMPVDLYDDIVTDPEAFE